MGVMRGDDDDFYEDDEPLEQVRALFYEGPHGVTAPPRHGAAAGQTSYFAPGGLQAVDPLPKFGSTMSGQPAAG